MMRSAMRAFKEFHRVERLMPRSELCRMLRSHTLIRERVVIRPRRRRLHAGSLKWSRTLCQIFRISQASTYWVLAAVATITARSLYVARHRSTVSSVEWKFPSSTSTPSLRLKRRSHDSRATYRIQLIQAVGSSVRSTRRRTRSRAQKSCYARQTSSCS